MHKKLLPSYTKAKASKLATIRQKNNDSRDGIKILWLVPFSKEGKSIYISKEMHKHTFFEAHFIIIGNAVYNDQYGNPYNINSCGGIIFPPDAKHIVVHQSDDILKFSLAFLPPKDSEIYKKLINIKKYTFDVSEKILNSLDDALAETEIMSFISDSIIENKINDILYTLIRTLKIDENSEKKPFPDEGNKIHISMAKRYIKDNNNKLLTCKEVAEQCHFNERYLGRIFKENVGMTMLEYIHREKIKYAENLLSESSYSLKEISTLLGFANEYYFNSFFKRYNGVSPGQFKKLSGK